MIKFTDEQKRELLADYIVFLEKSIPAFDELKEKCQEYKNFSYDEVIKKIQEAEKDLEKLDEKMYQYIFVSLLCQSSIEDKKQNEKWNWESIVGILALLAFCPSLKDNDTDKLS